jgi:hypothetical protein
LTSPHGPQGIASYPWEWLIDLGWIVYLNINPGQPASGLAGYHPAAHFLGLISPPLLLVALPALLLAAVGLIRTLPRRLRRLAPAPSPPALVGLAWFAGTFLPFAFQSIAWSRTSYIYYMVIVMPGLYIAAADLLARLRAHRRLLLGYGVLVLAAAVITYPFTPLP